VNIALVTLLSALLIGEGEPPYRIDGLAESQFVSLAGTAVSSTSGLTLTPDMTYKGGSAFWTCPLTLDFQSSFQVTLQFAIDGSQGTDGADGIAFVIQASAMGPAALGSLGGELAFGGVAPGFGVEFDTWQNAHEHDNNHVGLVSSGAPGKHIAHSLSPVDLNGGQTVYAWIEYSAPESILTVYMSAGANRPAEPVMGVSLVLHELIGGTGYMGLVAATGARKNRHVITQWQVAVAGQKDPDNDGLLNGCDDDDDGDDVPDEEDNCRDIANADQQDQDEDGIGDLCDETPGDGADADPDEDGLSNAEEAAAGTDPMEADTDRDTISDGDEAAGGVPVDTDQDGFPDALDSDSDGDGKLDRMEAGDLDWRTPPVDSDGDGIPDFRDGGEKKEPEEETEGETGEPGVGPGENSRVDPSSRPSPGASVAAPSAAAGTHSRIDPSQRPPAPTAGSDGALNRPSAPGMGGPAAGDSTDRQSPDNTDDPLAPDPGEQASSGDGGAPPPQPHENGNPPPEVELPHDPARAGDDPEGGGDITLDVGHPEPESQTWPLYFMVGGALLGLALMRTIRGRRRP